jgi:hypothetical protein
MPRPETAGERGNETDFAVAGQNMRATPGVKPTFPLPAFFRLWASWSV